MKLDGNAVREDVQYDPAYIVSQCSYANDLPSCYSDSVVQQRIYFPLVSAMMWLLEHLLEGCRRKGANTGTTVRAYQYASKSH